MSISKNPWTQIFSARGSIFALHEITKQWTDRGTSGNVVLFQNNNQRDDVRLKWEKNNREIWWQLTPSKLKPKGERAVVLKALVTITSKQEILAIRFSDQQSMCHFTNTYHQIFQMDNIHEPPQQNQNIRENGKKPVPKPTYQYRHNPPPPPQKLSSKKPPPPRRHISSDHNNQPYQYNPRISMADNKPLPDDSDHDSPKQQQQYVHKPPNRRFPVRANPNMKPPIFNRPKPNNPPIGLEYGKDVSWKCSVCTYQNNETCPKCLMCGLPNESKSNPVKPPGPAHVDIDDDIYEDPGHKVPDPRHINPRNKNKWECKACTFSNHSWTNRCEVCEAKRPINDNSPSPPQQTWSCPICTLVNSYKNKQCEACNAFRNVRPSNPRISDEKQMDPESHFNPIPEAKDNGYMNAMDAYKRMMDISMNHENPFDVNSVVYNQYDQHFESTPEDFSRAASDIACYNDNPSKVFSTVKSVAKKLLRDEAKYRTLDPTNPRVMERLIGYEGVIDFLHLLGFESDALGMKLICHQKPSPVVITNAIKVLTMYQQRFRMTNNGMMSPMGIPQNASMPKMENLNVQKTAGFDDDDWDKQNNESKNDILSMEQIIIWATHEKMQDMDTMETLIMTHKLFTDSLTLFKQLRKRFFVPIPPDCLQAPPHEKDEAIKQFQQEVQKPIQLKVIKAIRDWMKHYWAEDFHQNQAIQHELQQWLKELAVYEQLDTYNKNCAWITKLQKYVSQEYDRYRHQTDWNQPPHRKSFHLLSSLQDIRITHPNQINRIICKSTAEELADQITLIDYTLFSRIEPRECVHQRWKAQNDKQQQQYHQHILSLIEQFNSLTIFIQIQILREGRLKARALAIKRIIKMGEHFRVTRNYNSLCAVFSALSVAAIHRLKLAWSKVPEKYRQMFEEWAAIFDRHKNHRALRQLLRKAAGKPCIPHIGVFLKDLVFIDEGNNDKTVIPAFGGNKMLHFSKFVRIADRVKFLQMFQRHKYTEMIKENRMTQKVILMEFAKIKHVTEDQIWEMSEEVKKQDMREAKQPLAFLVGVGGHKNSAMNVIPPAQPAVV